MFENSNGRTIERQDAASSSVSCQASKRLDARGSVWRRLPPITSFVGYGRGRLVYFARWGIKATALRSYSRTRDALVVDHGIILRLAAVEKAKSARAAGEAWRRAIERALQEGRPE